MRATGDLVVSVYLRRQEGSTIHTDELDLQWLDRGKLLQYAARFPIPLKQQIVEAVDQLQHRANLANGSCRAGRDRVTAGAVAVVAAGGPV